MMRVYDVYKLSLRYSASRDEKSTLLSQISTLQSQYDRVQSRLDSISQTADNAIMREREAEGELSFGMSNRTPAIEKALLYGLYCNMYSSCKTNFYNILHL